VQADTARLRQSALIRQSIFDVVVAMKSEIAVRHDTTASRYLNRSLTVAAGLYERPPRHVRLMMGVELTKPSV
jgi:hypothetical protein